MNHFTPSSVSSTSPVIINNFAFTLPEISLTSSVGFELALAISDAKKKRNRMYNDWLAYRRKLADIKDQYLFCSAEIEDVGTLDENALIMSGLVIELGE